MTTQINYLPIYDKLFGGNIPRAEEFDPEFDPLNSSEDALEAKVALPVDFSIRDGAYVDRLKAWGASALHAGAMVGALHFFAGNAPARQTWLGVAYRVAQVAVLAYLARHVLQRCAMAALYPLQSRLVKCAVPICNTRNVVYSMQRWIAERLGIEVCNLDEARQTVPEQLWELTPSDWIVRHVTLEKNGVRYSGLMIGERERIANGQWVVQATGNMEPIEYTASVFAHNYAERGFNTLLVNGPAVGRSGGHAAPKSMGDAQEVALSFVETALKAKRIVFAGRSLGGAAIGQAIVQHPFKRDVHYLVVRQMTFDRTSNIIAKKATQVLNGLLRREAEHPWMERAVAWIIAGIGLEMDSVAASRRLSALGIKEVIVQASREELRTEERPDPAAFIDDEVICPKASLAHALAKEGVVGDKVFRGIKDAEHMANRAIHVTAEEIADEGWLASLRRTVVNYTHAFFA